MDCSFVTEEGQFNFRVGAVIVHDGRLLAMEGPTGEYYYLPGGRVRMNETMEEALQREIGEELDANVRVIRPLWFCEKFFDPNGEQNHKLSVYFLAELDWQQLPALEGQFRLADTDGDEHIFRWLSEEEVRSVRVHPVVLQESWPELPESFTICTEARRPQNL